MFKKKIYSESEVQEMMEALFLEKKKVKELELKINNCTLSPAITPSSEELTSLKAEIKTLKIALEDEKFKAGQSNHEWSALETRLKKDYENTIETLGSEKTLLSLHLEEKINEIRILQNRPLQEPIVDKKKELELERVVQFMRTRLEETQTEKHQYSIKIKELEGINKKAQEEIESRENLLKIEKEAFVFLQEEEHALKAQMAQLYEEISRLQQIIEDASFQEKKTQEETIALQKEIDLLKQMMMKSMQDFKEDREKEEAAYQTQIKTLLDDLKKEKEAAKNAEEQKTELVSLKIEYAQIKEAFENKTKAHFELAQLTEELKIKLTCSEEEKTAQEELLLQKNELTGELSAQIANLSDNLHEMKQASHEWELERQDHEANLRAAQSHLAKKLREAAILEEQNQALLNEKESYEKALEAVQEKLAEMKADSDAELAQAVIKERQYQEELKSSELQAEKWEKKFFQMQEKWQESEIRIRELKKLEERFLKLQHMFTHLGSVLTPEVKELPSFDIPPPAKTFTEMEIVPKEIQSSLFEAPKHSRYKETLFG